jgi:hypothetical protein
MKKSSEQRVASSEHDSSAQAPGSVARDYSLLATHYSLLATARRHAAPRRAMRNLTAAPWPRVYAQLKTTGEIFELDRGHGAGRSAHVDSFKIDFGPAWEVWAEFKRGENHVEGAADVSVVAPEEGAL